METGPTVTELVEAGLVNRQPHPSDGRAQLLVLTPLGEQVTEAATAAASAEWDRAVHRLDEETMQATATALELIGAGGTLHPVW